MKDYTKFGKKNHEKKVEVATVPVETVEIQNGVEEVVEVPEVNEVPETKQVIGVVTDCTKLNVREAPKANAKVVLIVDASTDLMIDEEGSTDTFYKVCTAAGIEGYCMKQFVTIKP